MVVVVEEVVDTVVIVAVVEVVVVVVVLVVVVFVIVISFGWVVFTFLVVAPSTVVALEKKHFMYFTCTVIVEHITHLHISDIVTFETNISET